MSSVINGLLHQVAEVIESTTPMQDQQRGFTHCPDATSSMAHRHFDVRLSHAGPVDNQLWSAAGRYLQRIGLHIRIAYRNSGACLSTSIITAEDATVLQESLLAASYSAAGMRGKPLWRGYTLNWNRDWVVATLRFELSYQEDAP